MKRILGLLVIVAMLLVCAVGCGSDEEKPNAEKSVAEKPAETEKIIVGVTMQDLSNEFIAMMKDAMEKRAKEKYPEMELTVVDAEGDATKQIQQMDTFIAQGVDVICICPRDANQLIPSCKNAIEAGIPVVVTGALIDADVGQFISTSVNEAGGEKLMTWVAEQLGGKGNIAIMRGPIGASAEGQRFEGFERVLNKNPDMKVVFDQTANWSREEGMALMENWLQTGVKIDALVSQNDEMALGAIQAIKAAGKLEEIMVVGMDGIPDALNSVENGEMACTCLQSAIAQGYGSIDMAYEAAHGAEPKTFDAGWMLVLPDNVDEARKMIDLDTYEEK